MRDSANESWLWLIPAGPFMCSTGLYGRKPFLKSLGQHHLRKELTL